MNGEGSEPGKPRGSPVVLLVVGAVVALAVAGLVAAVAASVLSARQKAVARQAELRRSGTAAALALAARGEALVAEYLKRDPSQPWQPVKIDLAEIDPEGRLGIAEAVVLLGPTLVGSSDPALPPGMLSSGFSEPSEDPRVEVIRGTARRSTPTGSRTTTALQFNVDVPAAGETVQGSAWLVVPLQR